MSHTLSSSPIHRPARPSGPPSTSVAGAGHRLHWVCLGSHVQRMVLRFCLPAHDLRALMARTTEVFTRSDADLQCEAASHTCRNAGAARWLQNRLDSHFPTAVRQVSGAQNEDGILAVWEEALQTGGLPGAYWAIVTDRRTSPRLSRIVTREMGERQRDTLRAQACSAGENDALHLQAASAEASLHMSARLLQAAKEARERAESLSAALMFQVHRREQAEMAALAAESDSLRLQQEAEQLRYTLGEQARELSAMEAQLCCSMARTAPGPNPLGTWIEGRKVLYVGGRPSSNPAIRTLVESLGGDYRRHEGTIDTQGGALAEALAWADVVVVPLDCFDRDSVVALRQACQRQGIDHVPLRTAGVASFVDGLGKLSRVSRPSVPVTRLCLRHG